MTLLFALIALPLLIFLLCTTIAIRLLVSLRIAPVTTCRGCGENLWGRPNIWMCPTCGGDRRVPRNLRGDDGGRSRIRRRRRAVNLVAAIMMICGTWVGIVIAYVAAGASLNQQKPTWLLMREAAETQESLDGRGSFADPAADNTDLGELTSRIPQLDAADIQAIADRAFRLQHVDAAPGGVSAAHQDWLHFVQVAHDQGRLPPAQWEKYLHQGVDQSVTMVMRQQVRRGDPLVLAIHCIPVIDSVRLTANFTSDYVPTIAGRKGGTVQPPPATIAGLQPWRDGTLVDLPADLLASLSDGPQSADVTASVNISDARNPGGPPVCTRTVTLHNSWILLSATSSSLSVDAGVQQNILDQMASATRVTFSGGGKYLNLNADYGQCTPYPFAFRVFVQDNIKDWEVGEGVTQSGSLAADLSPSDYLRRGKEKALVPFPKKVNVIIRPADENAVRTLDCTRTWRGEIFIEGVEVQ